VAYCALTIVSGGSLDPRVVPDGAWPGLVAIGFLASFLAIQAFYAAVRRIGAARAALISTVEPVIIVTLAWVFLGEYLAPIQFVGAACIMVGVVIAQTAPRPRGAPEPAMPLDAEAPSED
jgi:drug/metabolite transporter (DMT)-like permease